MSKIDIFLLDNSNNTKEEINIIKPQSYQELLKQIGQKMKYIPKFYEIFIFDKDNKEIKIYNEKLYNKIEDILFIREINKNILEHSLFDINYNILSESRQEKLDEIYNCILCSIIIKNENPYFCYKCQKIFHEKCLKDWDKKCKTQNKALQCPNCRNELPLDKWNKKLNYEESRKENANLLNRIKEYKLNNNMNKNINIIKDKKINELKENENNQNELIKKYEKYIKKTEEIIKNIFEKIKSIHYLLKLKETNKLNTNTINLTNYSELNDISNIIYDELEQFKNYIINNQKNNINESKRNISNIHNDKEININNKVKNKLIMNNNFIKDNEEIGNQDNIKENLSNFLFNFAEFIHEINSYEINEIKKENFVYLVHKDILIKYLRKYNLNYFYINDKILKEHKELSSIKNSINEYINREYKFSNESKNEYNHINIESINKESKNELPYIIVKNNSEKIHYYHNCFLLNEKTIKLLDINLAIFPKLEYYSKEQYIFLFQPNDQGTIIDIGKLDNQKMFKIENLINTTKDTRSIIKMINSRNIYQFFGSFFIFISKNIKISPFFDEENNEIGYSCIIKDGFKNFSNCHYNQNLVNIIYLIIYFKFPKYELAKLNSEKNYFLINENWITNFKNKYMYQATKREIENNNNKNISIIINKEQNNKKLLNKMIYYIIAQMDELNKKYNSFNNLVYEEIPSEPECESIKDFNGGKEFFFFNNFYVLDEDIHNKLFNQNDKQSKDTKIKNNYCKCFYTDGYFFIILNQNMTKLSKFIVEVGNLDEEQKFKLTYLIVFNSKRDYQKGIDIMKQFGFKNYFNFINFNEQNMANLYIDELGKINGYIYYYSRNKNNNIK